MLVERELVEEGKGRGGFVIFKEVLLDYPANVCCISSDAKYLIVVILGGIMGRGAVTGLFSFLTRPRWSTSRFKGRGRLKLT